MTFKATAYICGIMMDILCNISHSYGFCKMFIYILHSFIHYRWHCINMACIGVFKKLTIDEEKYLIQIGHSQNIVAIFFEFI